MQIRNQVFSARSQKSMDRRKVSADNQEIHMKTQSSLETWWAALGGREGMLNHEEFKYSYMNILETRNQTALDKMGIWTLWFLRFYGICQKKQRPIDTKEL